MTKRLVGIGLAAILMGAGFSAFQGAPRALAAGATTRPVRLTKPWNELKDLTDDQATKIKAIHEKALAETHQIEAKEKADCLAVLTEAQKKEYEAVLVKDKKEAAERRMEREHATTEPSAKPSKPAK